MSEDKFIELRILAGLIVSTEYTQKIRNDWNPRLLESGTIRQISGWCIEYYDKYNKSPSTEIESIFVKKTKKLKEEVIEDIEDILADLSSDYEREEQFNVKYLYDQTVEYFESRSLNIFANTILEELEKENISEARTFASKYIPPVSVTDENLDFSKESILDIVEEAFRVTNEPLIRYPRALGKFLNDKLVRGAFVAFMGPEKRGKTFLLLDIVMRSLRQNLKVAFFQAGDMSQYEQVLRIAIYLAKKSTKKKYCGTMYEPVRDCIFNQMGSCTLKQREGTDSVFDDKDEDFFKSVTINDLKEAYNENPDHKVCHNCNKFWTHKYGTPWVKKIKVMGPLTEGEAKNHFEKFFLKKKKQFRLSTHANQTLTVGIAENILDRWEHEESFVPDIIIFDYADIMKAEERGDFRHQENHKWMRLRGLSQKRNALVITPTQTDADSYDTDLLTLKNFSEDKRKFAHVTAMFGLNQDKRGREKDIGIMRINEIVVREDAFSSKNQVTVLQNLSRGIPILASY